MPFESLIYVSIDAVMNALKSPNSSAICSLSSSEGKVFAILFISEFLMVREMFVQQHYLLCVAFLILLTIILFGLAKAVLNMSYGDVAEDKKQALSEKVKELSISMYAPQICLLAIAFVLGVYIPLHLGELIQLSIFGL